MHTQERCNELENPIGIETLLFAYLTNHVVCCNELENPIGIETYRVPIIVAKGSDVATNLKTR